MKKSLIVMACLGACALVLAACGKEKRFSAGEEMNAEEIKAYREKLMAQTEPSVDEAPETAPEAGEDALPAVCYYTEKGTKWHASLKCRYLRKSVDILEGSLESAHLAGKTSPCSGCAAAYTEE
ncbi:MAG: hypothetical protein IJY50_08220 [Clostridia bacterium]|nr:hypothetical protein [Clostridia bacterium]